MEKFKHLNSLILNATITGESDCTGPITIYHKKTDRYLFVLVEEYTGDWYHRIFVCDKDFRYERGYILEPIIGMESLLKQRRTSTGICLMRFREPSQTIWIALEGGK